MRVYVYNKANGNQVFILKHAQRLEAEPEFWNIFQDEIVSHISRKEYMITCYGY